MIYKILLIIFYAMGATFDFYMYKDTDDKGFLIPFLGFLLGVLRNVRTMLTLSVATLHDEFDFGAKRCQRFIERMNLKAECIVDDLATWDDFIGQIREELGIQIVIRRND